MLQNPVVETEDPGCSTSFGTSFLGGPGPAFSAHQAQFLLCAIVRADPSADWHSTAPLQLLLSSL